MPKESSVAPKERVNIVYRPATGGANEEVELPLKILVMGDYTLKENETPVEDRKPVNIDKDNFNDVLSAQKVGLETVVDNTLTGEENAKLNVNLDFKTMRDFEPDAIIRKVPELTALVELREALKALKGPLGNVPEFRKKIQELVKDAGARERLLKELGIEQ
ncbi:MAG: type VI secretion system contractile sheath small subunit [Candidatus Latescibacteria bacterium]|nr:type VI secretion system contractile sheath small subunit [Candidatus Latescibacterota bacterium]